MSNECPIPQLTLDLGFPPGKISLYLYKLDSYNLLIDAGPYIPQYIETLEKKLSNEFGLSMHDLTTIAYTHVHVDHAGMSGFIAEKYPSIQQWIHKSDADFFKIIETYWPESVKNSGAPPDVLEALAKQHYFYQKIRTPLSVTNQFYGTQTTFTIGKKIFEVIHVPGHSPGCVIYIDHKNEIVLSGDHILDKISPIISYSSETFDGLGLYLQSLQKLLKWKSYTFWPAHGNVITNVEERVKFLLKHHDKRIKEVYQQLKKKEITTPYELIPELFEFDLPTDQFSLAIAEINAHLYHLQHKGLAVKINKTQWKVAE